MAYTYCNQQLPVKTNFRPLGCIFDRAASKYGGKIGVIKTTFALICLLATPSYAEDRQPTAILPSLSALLPPDSPLRLKFPEKTSEEAKKENYERTFPLGAQAAIERGVILPKPWGISVTFVDNSQAQKIENLAVALGKGMTPPPDTPLVDLPFVEIQNARSNTTTRQIRADLWVLPFLNVFGAVGTVEGRVPLDVVVDIDETGLCPPVATCGTVGASFDAGVDTNIATLGLTGVYGWDNWFTSGSASFTDSFGGNTEDAVRSYTASVRLGRRWAFGSGNIIAPYVGVSYLDLDQEVEGTTRLRDAFPDGDDLELRYTARISNEDKFSGVVGFNLGFIQGISFSGEYNVGENSDRFVVSTTYRF